MDRPPSSGWFAAIRGAQKVKDVEDCLKITAAPPLNILADAWCCYGCRSYYGHDHEGQPGGARWPGRREIVDHDSVRDSQQGAHDGHDDGRTNPDSMRDIRGGDGGQRVGDCITPGRQQNSRARCDVIPASIGALACARPLVAGRGRTGGTPCGSRARANPCRPTAYSLERAARSDASYQLEAASALRRGSCHGSGRRTVWVRDGAEECLFSVVIRLKAHCAHSSCLLQQRKLLKFSVVAAVPLDVSSPDRVLASAAPPNFPFQDGPFQETPSQISNAPEGKTSRRPQRCRASLSRRGCAGAATPAGEGTGFELLQRTVVTEVHCLLQSP